MNFIEHAGKELLETAGIRVLPRRLATTADEAAAAVAEIGPAMVKAQVPAGKRGKAGGIKPAAKADQAGDVAGQILAMEIGGHPVTSVLVEAQAEITQEYYAAVLNDPVSKKALLMFSAAGGMDIEEIAATHPQALRTLTVDVREQPTATAIRQLVGEEPQQSALAAALLGLYRVYRQHDAELVEINPLARLADDSIVALDCKFVLDDSAVKRQPELAANGEAERLSSLEQRGQALGLRYIALHGSIGVLANGAGLTMTTMDVIAHHGGEPANFLEIGGEAYTKATAALELVLDNPEVKALVVNFCGAFARTDVMTEGVINAWETLKPAVPVFFSVHGTGAAEARAMLQQRLDIVPYDTMDQAIQAAVEAAQ